MSPVTVPDGFTMNKDGTCTLRVEGEMWRLRRARLGEFRKLREALRDRDDARMDLMAAMASPTDRPDADAAPEAKAAYGRDLAARARTLSDKVEDLDVQWVAMALKMLCDHDPPPRDLWPAEMGTTEFVLELVKHWRTVPLGSGGP